MTYIPDLSSKLYSEPPEPGYTYLSVGWLGNTIAHTASTPPDIIEKLRWHAVENPNPNGYYMGTHTCEICQDYQNTGEFFITDDKTRYMFPSMVFHYIEDHSYALPQCVLDALEKFSIPDIEYVVSHRQDHWLHKNGLKPLRYDAATNTVTAKIFDESQMGFSKKQLGSLFGINIIFVDNEDQL